MGIFDAFTGAAQRRDLEAGTRRANAALSKGLANARGELTTGYDNANAMLQPFVGRGSAGLRAYGDLLGLEGADARADMQDVITSDPIFQGQVGQHTNALLRNLNARGLSGSGLAALAGQRAVLENYNRMLDRYANLGRQGQVAAGQSAGLAYQHAGDLGNLEFGTAANRANLATDMANATAASRGAGLNNMLRLAGLGVRGVGVL